MSRIGPLGFSDHEWGVLLPLAFVGFFLNYDTGLLSLAAPSIADGLGVEVATFGIGVAVIRLAAIASVPVLRHADRIGRRRTLLLSVTAFTIATALTALAWGLVAFVVFQLFARLFLATEESVAGIVISEELRPDRRGAGLSMLGIIAMAGFGLVALMLLVVPATPLGWRVLYVAALPPLLVVAWLRRSLRETTAFEVAAADDRVQSSFWPHVDAAHRPDLWRVTLLLGAAGVVATPAFFYAAELAQDVYGWEGLFTVIVLASGPMTLAGYVVGGRVSDRYGRRPVILGCFVVAVAGVALVFSEERWLFAPGFFLMAATDAGFIAVRPAYISELFPTEVRATLLSFVFAVVVAGGSLGLVVIGVAARWTGMSTSVAVVVLTAAMATSLVVLPRLPETAGRDVVRAPTSRSGT
ncbi:MAG TPA: MFS transporter [Acidimicrobiales bacterium]|nr:MFS transporter [Acidimicrobiales bacterium]